MKLRSFMKWRLYSFLGLLMALTLVIMACGDDPAPVPTAPKAVPTATPTSPPAAVAAKPAAKPKPKPTATARPRATPTPTPKPKVLVSPRLKVSMVPPGHQVTMVHQTYHSSSGPLKTMFEELIYIDPLVGDYSNDHLATDWSMSDDGTSWSFTIRKGVPFHDIGTEVTVKDVIHSIRTSAGETSYNPGRWNIYGVADKNFDVHDDHSFTYNMDAPEPLLLGHLSEGALVPIISKDHWDSVGGEEKYAEHPIGTGPFKFVELEIGEGLLVERTTDHWRKTPEFHELKMFYTPESATRLAMLLAKEVHLADIARTLLPEANQRGFKTVLGTLPGMFFFAYFGGLYYDEPKEILAGSRKGEIEPLAEGYIADNPLRKLLVRKAMNLAIDRELIIKTFWGDAAVPASTYGIPPGRPDFKEEWVPYPYDPDEAKRLLAEAGYPEGFEFTLTTGKMGGTPEAPEVAEALASMWKDIGLKMTIEDVELGEILKRARNRTWGQNVYTLRYGAGNPFPSDPCYPMSAVPGGCGNPTWEYDELDQLYLKFKAAVKHDDMVKAEQDIGDYLYDNYLLIPLAFLYPVSAYDPGVIESYTANWQHWGPVRHHEYTVPVYK